MKSKILLSVAIMLALMAACTKENPGQDEPVVPPPTPQKIDSAAVDFWEKAFECSGFESFDSLTDGVYMRDGMPYEWDKSKVLHASDNRYEFYNAHNQLRYVSKTDGYAITLPGADSLTLDYTAPKYGMYFTWENKARLRITAETVQPSFYTLEIYKSEWMDRYISNPKYIKANKMKYTSETISGASDIVSDWLVDLYSIEITEPGAIEYPFYKIAIIYKNDSRKLALLVYKSKALADDTFLEILKSYKTVTARGTAKNYYEPHDGSVPSSWSAETGNFYDNIRNQQKFDFGVFSYSMAGDDDPDYNTQHDKIKNEKERLESASGLGRTYGIMPTYQALSWYGIRYGFPLDQAKEFAGGNGVNGKPVLQMSFQYTTDNNNVSPTVKTGNVSPVIDILRGKHDEYLREYAAKIKAYGKPIFFRLNNEMNSDWTSYCGMMTLLDPELFIQSWKYLYDMFIEEGATNTIWIFNPIATSCPYSNWGEAMAYYPGDEYVQCYGLTNYEMGNDVPFESFRDKYSDIYSKYSGQFGAIPWIIGEFACGCGGNSDGRELKRNKEEQAQWVTDMFTEFRNYDANEYLHPIKGIIWFSCNDYSGELIVNQLSLDSDLTSTLKAFRDGFAEFDQL